MPSDVNLRYSLRLLSAGPDRLRTMAALRQLRPDLSLKSAKALMETIPCTVLAGIPMREREKARQAFLWIADAEVVSDWTGTAPTPPGVI